MGQAFKRKRNRKKAKRKGKEDVWHINKDHETVVVNNNTEKELEGKLVEENSQRQCKEQDQDETWVIKENGDRAFGSQSNEDVERAYGTNENSKEIVEDGKALDLSLSSCSSEIQIFSESD